MRRRSDWEDKLIGDRDFGRFADEIIAVIEAAQALDQKLEKELK